MQTQSVDWRAFACVCGNQLDFYFCDVRGEKVSPDNWSSDCIRCTLCGRVIHLGKDDHQATAIR